MARHTYLCPLRWADMDRFGHVNNTQFIAYLEQARVDLLFEHASSVGVSTLAAGMVVARHEIEYLRPVRYRHRPLRVDLWCDEPAGASVVINYELYDSDSGTGGDGAGSDGGPVDRIVATARSLLVPYDLTAQRLRRFTSEEREFLRRYTEDPAA